jgi:ABC-2 type transport system ATP-binding protein
MVIICLGEVVVKGNLTVLTEVVKGRVWKKAIQKTELANYQNEMQVISTHLKAGQTIIHVLSDNKPDASFETSPANLEDVYFAEITSRMETVTA